MGEDMIEEDGKERIEEDGRGEDRKGWERRG